jgi:hypothetical protein
MRSGVGQSGPVSWPGNVSDVLRWAGCDKLALGFQGVIEAVCEIDFVVVVVVVVVVVFVLANARPVSPSASYLEKHPK